METLRAGWFKRAGELVSQGLDMSPRTGVWHTHVSRRASLSIVLLSIGSLAFLVMAWLIEGRSTSTWHTIAAVSCTTVMSLISQAVTVSLDTDAGRPPSNRVFALWTALTALIGLPLTHLILYLAALVQPLDLAPFLAKYFPEMLIAVGVLLSYWRLVIVRLWFERLATEKLKRQAAEQGRALVETQLHLLEAQIEPHFLFNTLASVQHLVRKDAAQADLLLAQLISYLRQAMPDMRGGGSTLGRELDLVRTYLDIVRVRMGGRLAVVVESPAEMAEAPFPSLVVHTLVENAIKHGVELKPGPVRITVRARQALHDGQDCIDVSVEDNGVAREADAAGAALAALRDRLALAYQGHSRLELSAAAGGGVCAAVSIPLR